MAYTIWTTPCHRVRSRRWSYRREAKIFLSRIGTELKEKGVGTHARIVDRHHAMLRQAFLEARASSEEE
eukprot:3795507-Prorocentrum_lima.AAC.1